MSEFRQLSFWDKEPVPMADADTLQQVAAKAPDRLPDEHLLADWAQELDIFANEAEGYLAHNLHDLADEIRSYLKG